jgi:glucosamine--fructose-6-phosphate aminotransferase (isomerizing)
MCGITGYIGPRNGIELAIDQLHRLEYRGYDSAGIAFPQNGGLRVIKSEGKIARLESLLEGEKTAAFTAVAHTRWATHGKPSHDNAHPHTDCTGRVAVVHNGIIENYLELRHALQSRGHAFSSETDTEVIAHLIEEQLEHDLPEAVRKVLPQLRGSYAIAVLSTVDRDKIVVARKDSPLIIGLGEGENFVASDIPAVMRYTRRVIVLEDGEMAVVTRDSAQVMRMDGTPITREPMEVTWDESSAEKGGYPHFMLKEIHEEPRTLRDTLRGRISQDGLVAFSDLSLSPEELRRFKRILITACGTALHAGMVGKIFYERLLRRPVDIWFASEFRYGDPIVDEETLAIIISQSGETADTLAALRACKEHGATTLGIVNVVGSSIAREAHHVLYTYAGPEICVASTKAYITQLAVLYLLGIYLAQLEGRVSDSEARQMVREVQSLSDKVERVLQGEEQIIELARRLAPSTCFFYLGRGYDYAVSLEAALKLKEISYIHAEAYPAGEMKHGPLALVEPGVTVVAFATQPNTFEKMVSNMKEVKAREGFVLAVAPEGEEHILHQVADEVISIPPVHPAFAPVVSIVPMQLLAYYIARERGCEIDQPRNLAKSVTVE